MNVSIHNLKEILPHNYIFIDLREKRDYNRLHIKKFINIPYNDFRYDSAFLKKDIPIYLICYSGARANVVARRLNQIGYQAYSFVGGFHALNNPINPSFF